MTLVDEKILPAMQANPRKPFTNQADSDLFGLFSVDWQSKYRIDVSRKPFSFTGQ